MEFQFTNKWIIILNSLNLLLELNKFYKSPTYLYRFKVQADSKLYVSWSHFYYSLSTDSIRKCPTCPQLKAASVKWRARMPLHWYLQQKRPEICFKHAENACSWREVKMINLWHSLKSVVIQFIRSRSILPFVELYS